MLKTDTKWLKRKWLGVKQAMSVGALHKSVEENYKNESIKEVIYTPTIIRVAACQIYQQLNAFSIIIYSIASYIE